MEVKKYTVALLFNSEGSKILLQKKDRTAFAGMLNGVGGKVEEDEHPMQGALREIEEETSIKPTDLERFEWIGTLTLPEQCDDKNPDMYPEIWFFAGIVKDENLAHKPEAATEEIDWLLLFGYKPVTNIELAGHGDLPYFIGVAKRLLFNRGITAQE